MASDTPGSLNTYQDVVGAFTEFLTVAIHLILFERSIYPRESFLRTRKYDTPVQQNRHPKVCTWITDAVAAVGDEMLKCTVRQTSVVLYSSDSTPLERYIFSTDHFPVVDRSDILVPLDSADRGLRRSSPANNSRPMTPNPQDPSAIAHKSAIFDLTAQFAAVLSRISTQTARLAPLPDGCSFTVAIELRDPPTGRVPVDNQATWLPAEPGLQPALSAGKGKQTEREAEAAATKTRGLQRRGEYLGGLRTMAVRLVEVGPFVMEVWIEEGKDQPSSNAQVSSAGAKEATSSARPARHAHFEDADDEA